MHAILSLLPSPIPHSYYTNDRGHRLALQELESTIRSCLEQVEPRFLLGERVFYFPLASHSLALARLVAAADSAGCSYKILYFRDDPVMVSSVADLNPDDG